MIHVCCHGCPHDIGEALGHAQHASGGRIGHAGLGGMAQGRGNAFLATVVERHDAAVAQRQLHLPLCLLAGHLARHRAVHLVGEPVLTGHCFQLQHVVEVFVQMLHRVGGILVVAHHSLVAHHRLGRMTEHLGHVEVERLHAVALPEAEVGVARGAAHHIQRGTLTLGDALHMVEMLLVNEQSHALLALVGDNFLGAQGLVADRQLGHVYLAATLLHQFGEAVQVAGRAVVVDGDHGIHVFFDQGAHQIVGAFLHFGVGSLHGIQLDAAGVAAGVHARHRAAAQSDAVVVAAHDHNFVTRPGLFLQAVALFAIAHAACQHDDFVVAIDLRGSPRPLRREGSAVRACCGVGG